MSSTQSRNRRVGVCLLQGMLALSGFAQPVSEYQVKAAFLYNFAKFVEWPPETFKSERSPLRICLLGRDPFAGSLNAAVAGKTATGRSLELVDVSDARHADGCQILFVSSPERKNLRSSIAELPGIGILTVGESEGFASNGGIINFKLEDGRVRLEINVEAAGHAGLRISSKVLNVAEIIKLSVKK